MNIYADIDSLDGTRQLRFSVSGPNVRVTQRFIDPFDADDDFETIFGDFNLEILRARLATLGTHTASVPTVPQASRPGRRKPRRWWNR